MALLLRLIIFILIAIFIFRMVRGLLRMGSPTAEPRENTLGNDPYSVLGVSPQATHIEIKKAYKEQLTKYHPDKVGHLGEEIQIVAKNKTKEIIEAYKTATRNL